MNLFDLIPLLGGLAIFLYGMSLMSDGLFKISGSNVERIIESATNNKLKGILFGIGVTALIQSSSATTVMVVGFVNAGYMKLSQAISVIMGSNIGTTVTAWILSILGLESNNIFIQILKPSTFAPILAFLSILIIMSTKNKKRKILFESIFGFAILMIGMDTMSSTMAPLSQDSKFISIMSLFTNPILSLFIGLIITAIIQSSSASVGILQALSLSGTFTIESSIPIILGQNIGTCITSLISSVGTSNNAKRAAFSHLFFNIIGSIIFYLALVIIKVFIKLDILYQTSSPLSIAILHSIFNISITIIIIPFINYLEKLTYAIVPKSEDEKKLNVFSILDDKFIKTPSFALDKCHSLISNMASMNLESINAISNILKTYDKDLCKVVDNCESECDNYEDNLKKYFSKLNAIDKSKRNALRLSAYTQCANDFERISDHLYKIKLTAEQMNSNGEIFTESAIKELGLLSSATKELLENTINIIDSKTKLLYTIEPLNDVIGDIQKNMLKNHIKRVQSSECTPQAGFLYSDITNSFIRIAAYCTNIAISFVQENDENVLEHNYQNYLSRTLENYNEYKQKYIEKYSIN